jgi:acetyltransferase-like isoleucine patch superfamily enzyme
MSWKLFSLGYIARALSGKYILASDEEVCISPLAKLLNLLQVPTCYILSLPCRIPVVDQLCESFSRNLPESTLGFLLRGIYWKAKLGSMGEDTFIGSDVLIRGPKNISLGHNVSLGRKTCINALKGGLTVGDFSEIGTSTFIQAGGGVEIGSYSAISAHCCIYSATHDMDGPFSPSTRAPVEMQKISRSKITIGDYSLIGAGSILLPKGKVGSHTAIGAGSLVNSDIPDYCIAVGLPAKVIGGQND